MIRGYGDHAANERTFLAWVRTGIAVVAFGFVIEKFNLFILMIANTPGVGRLSLPQNLPGRFGRHDGLVLIITGLVVIAVAGVRLIQTRRLLEDDETHSAPGIRAELILSGALASIVAGFSAYLVFD